MTEPNFDDERTLQRARRVVPLNQIDSKVKHRRAWVLGGAFVLAMLLGAGSALVASYIKLRQLQSAQTAQSDSEAEPVAAAGDTPSTETAFIEEVEQPAPEPSPKKTLAVRHKPVVKPVEPLTDPPHDEKVSEAQALNQIRDTVLYDEWQERRARRVSRRDRRRERYNHRDLSNLDEIFEGRRRPRNP